MSDITNLENNADAAPGERPNTNDMKAGAQRIELTLKKISESSGETLHCWPASSACSSGCFSSVSSIEVKSGDLGSYDEMQLERVIRMHDRAIEAMGQDALVTAAITKGHELGKSGN